MAPELLAAQHRVGVAEERLQERELPRRQLDDALADLRPARPQIEAQRSGVEHGRFG